MEKLFKAQGYVAALKYLYKLSVEFNYIKEERLKLNIIFPPFQYSNFNQNFQITINRSKPEIIQPTKKSETAIPPKPDFIPAFTVSQPNLSSTFGGQCNICFENVDSIWKPNLRVWEFTINGREFFLQYSPFPYFNLHACITEKVHTPQIISEITIQVNFFF